MTTISPRDAIEDFVGREELLAEILDGVRDASAADPPEQAAIVQQAIREQVRLSSSLGVGACKVVCKIASDMKKPGGITYVPDGQEAAFLAPLEVRRLPGVGPKSEQRLTASRLHYGFPASNQP